MSTSTSCTVKKSHQNFEFLPGYSNSSDGVYHQLGQKLSFISWCIFIHHRWHKIRFCSTDVQKPIAYVRKWFPSSLMKNVETVWEYFEAEVRLSPRMSENSTKCHKIPLNVIKFH
jgi:hypothetical protein